MAPGRFVLGFGQLLKEVHPARALGHAVVACLWLFVGLIGWEGVMAVNEGRSALEGLQRSVRGFDPQRVDEFSRIQTVVRDLLDDLRMRTEADRAVFVMLHNGKTSLDGVPFLSVSGFAEAYDSNLSSAIAHFVDLPLPEVYGVQETLRGETLIYRPNDFREGEIVSSIGVDVVLRGPVIRSFNGVPHGWVFLGYTDREWEALKDRRDRFAEVMGRYTAIITGVINATSISELIGAVESHEQLEAESRP